MNRCPFDRCAGASLHSQEGLTLIPNVFGYKWFNINNEPVRFWFQTDFSIDCFGVVASFRTAGDRIGEVPLHGITVEQTAFA